MWSHSVGDFSDIKDKGSIIYFEAHINQPYTLLKLEQNCTTHFS